MIIFVIATLSLLNITHLEAESLWDESLWIAIKRSLDSSKTLCLTVYIGAQGVRFTQEGVDGVRRVLPGEYTVRFGVKETFELGMRFTEVKVLAQ